MFCRTVGALAALSIGANALLLPPGVSRISDSRNDAFGLAIDPKSQALKVPCPSCAFPSSKQESVQENNEGDNVVWIQGGANDVLFNFTVAENDKDLLLNGVKVYPVDGFMMGEPTVGQVRSSVSLADIKKNPEQVTPLRVSSAGIGIQREAISPADDSLVRISYQIGELESQSITVDAIELKLLEDADGSLIIISVDAIPHDVRFDHLPSFGGDIPPPPPPSAEKECNMLPAALCKWKSAVEDKISGFKPGMPHAFGGCGGRRPHKLPGHIRPHFDKPEDGERPDRRPHHGPGSHPHPHHGPHGPHGFHHGPHHHRHHHFFGRFVRAFIAVLIPVMAGITMGMFVSLIGMLVGRLISFLWIQFRRGGQRGYASVAQSENDAETAGKDLVIVEEVVDEEPLPKYEDAPAYNEKE